MPAVPLNASRGQEVSCIDRTWMGAKMGMLVGGGFGILLGAFTALRGGYRGVELLKMAGKSTAQSAGTFGTFLAIGSAIRC
ncbi:reactive oxygen species modulator 1-like [Tropilaelaps mercedesae]|uniref:Reactive oxygen species modulator 1 n=1 Tax=Tropilaelaps mercedesae TaxID=418985 RepID=A0A1V9XQT5_9ACAR|nr:reactive oxygen species modulator 1-like [Tropilaelaps mercedesae]